MFGKVIYFDEEKVNDISPHYLERKMLKSIKLIFLMTRELTLIYQLLMEQLRQAKIIAQKYKTVCFLNVMNLKMSETKSRLIMLILRFSLNMI